MSEQQDHVSKSSCSSISTSTHGSEEEVTIGTLITEATSSGKSLGRRLSHLDSIPVLISHFVKYVFLIMLVACASLKFTSTIFF
jgi:hypothetical protein